MAMAGAGGSQKRGRDGAAAGAVRRSMSADGVGWEEDGPLPESLLGQTGAIGRRSTAFTHCAPCGEPLTFEGGSAHYPAQVRIWGAKVIAVFPGGICGKPHFLKGNRNLVFAS